MWAPQPWASVALPLLQLQHSLASAVITFAFTRNGEMKKFLLLMDFKTNCKAERRFAKGRTGFGPAVRSGRSGVCPLKPVLRLMSSVRASISRY